MQDEFLLEDFPSEFPDMAGQTADQRIASLEAKAENTKAKLDKVEQDLSNISATLGNVRRDLGWHRWIGWGIAVIYAGIFVWFLNSYLPDKFNDKLPEHFKEDWGKLQQNVSNIQDRLNRLTPSTLNQVLSLPEGSTPTAITTRLHKASQIVDVALKTRLPGDPDSLYSLAKRAGDIAQEHPKVRDAALGTEVRLESYALASKRLLEGLQPRTDAPQSPKDFADSSYLINFTITCRHPTADFAQAESRAAAQNVVIFDVTVIGCQQDLTGFRWINTKFRGNTMRYYGGPLYLADVRFENVQFDFGSDATSQQVLANIRAHHGKPVTELVK